MPQKQTFPLHLHITRDDTSSQNANTGVLFLSLNQTNPKSELKILHSQTSQGIFFCKNKDSGKKLDPWGKGKHGPNIMHYEEAPDSFQNKSILSR